MSEAELHLIKSRMHQGLLHKAKKGELRLPLPAGYQHDTDGKIIKSLDEQIIHVIDLTFSKFFEIGSVHGVVRYFTDNHIQFPRKAVYEKKERWVQPYYKALVGEYSYYLKQLSDYRLLKTQRRLVGSI